MYTRAAFTALDVGKKSCEDLELLLSRQDRTGACRKIFLVAILAALIIGCSSASKAETDHYTRSSMGVVNGYAVAVHLLYVTMSKPSGYAVDVSFQAKHGVQSVRVVRVKPDSGYTFTYADVVNGAVSLVETHVGGSACPFITRSYSVRKDRLVFLWRSFACPST